jgi:hypothetical protein
MPLPMPGGHVWTDFLQPAAHTNASAITFAAAVQKDVHHLRETAPLVMAAYLDTSSGDVIPGDLVRQLGGTGTAWKVIRTTTLGETGLVGVMLDAATHVDGLLHQAQFSGVVDVNVQMGVVTGDWLRCSATDGKAETCAPTDPGAFMVALTDSATISGGQVTVLLYPSLAAGVGAGGSGGTTGWFVDSTPVPAEPQVDFIAGSNITLTPVDNTGAGRTEITIASSGGGSSSGIGGSLAQLTVPVLASMTQVNASGCTFTQSVYLLQPAVGGHSVAMAVQALGVSAPYHARCAFFAASPPTFWYGGLILRESSSGKLILWGIRGDGTIAGHYYSAPTAFGSFITGGGTPAPAAMKSGMWWFEIYNDGTNNRYRMSPDGRHWAEIINAELNNAHLVADQIGFGVNGAGATDSPQLVVTHLDCSATSPLPEIT